MARRAMNEEQTEEAPVLAPQCSKEFQRLLDEHLFDALYKQRHVGEMVRGRPWTYSLTPGPDYAKLVFGDESTGMDKFNFQILGTESHISATWLWSWANEYGGLPVDLTTMAGRLKRGEVTQRVPAELTEGQMDLKRVQGHQLAMVAVGLLACPGYYRCAQAAGASFLIITDPEFPKKDPSSVEVMQLVEIIEQ
eukprot:4769538-Amphidinium_carterae.1